MNCNQITRQDVLDLMMEDGFGPDEVIGHAAEYASELTGRRASKTAIMRVQTHARGIMRDARNDKA